MAESGWKRDREGQPVSPVGADARDGVRVVSLLGVLEAAPDHPPANKPLCAASSSKGQELRLIDTIWNMGPWGSAGWGSESPR